jgi:hypothetical protein
VLLEALALERAMEGEEIKAKDESFVLSGLNPGDTV